MRVRLKQGTRPEVPKEVFEESEDEESNTYWGLERKWFEVCSGTVKLAAKIASHPELVWNVVDNSNGVYWVYALPESLDLGDSTVHINPGFWYTAVDEEQVREDWDSDG